MTMAEEEGLSTPASDIEDVYRLVRDGPDWDHLRGVVNDDSTTNTSRDNNMGPVMNLCSATLGAGVVALPYAVGQTGWIGGWILLVGAAMATYYSIVLLGQACLYYKVHTYEGLVQDSLGRPMRSLVEISILLFCVGCAVAYVIAVGDILEQVGLQRHYVVVVWLFVMLPTSLARTMKGLEKVSALGIASIGILLLTAVCHCLQQEHHYHPWWPHGSVLRAGPVVVFAFSCQVNVCAIFHELLLDVERGVSSSTTSSTTINTRALQRLRHVARGAVAICTTLYAGMSLFALLDFQTVPPNILSNYHPLAAGSMGVAVTVAFCLNIFPARVVVGGMCCASTVSMEPHATLTAALLVDQEEENNNETTSDNNDDDATTSPDNDDSTTTTTQDTRTTPMMELSTVQHVSVTLLLAGTALILGILVPDISIVFGLLGGTTTSLLGFVVPGLLGVQMKIPSSWILVVGGSLFGVITTAVTIADIIGKSSNL